MIRHHKMDKLKVNTNSNRHWASCKKISILLSWLSLYPMMMNATCACWAFVSNKCSFVKKASKRKKTNHEFGDWSTADPQRENLAFLAASAVELSHQLRQRNERMQRWTNACRPVPTRACAEPKTKKILWGTKCHLKLRLLNTFITGALSVQVALSEKKASAVNAVSEVGRTVTGTN